MNATTADAPTHVAIELRITAAQAEALDAVLLRIAKLLKARVLNYRSDEEKDDAEAAVEKLRQNIAQRAQPFEMGEP